MSERGLALLGGLTPARFLAEYWQKKPLLVRQALPGFRSPLSPDELAGLACEDGVEARLILERDGARPWQLEHGPFPEARFASLPESHWTLLVQRVNQWLPEVAALLDHFAFLPDWRLDDVMVSYAADQGSVGPHTDQYDVFLIQGLGRRRWQIDATIGDDAPLLEHPDLRILREFSPTDEWILEPGDMLYLPPGLAHCGVALGDDCMTYSVGFRAPAYRELVTAWVDDVIALLPDTLRFADPDRTPATHPGALSAADRQRIREIIRQTFMHDDAIDHWFGRYITTPAGEAAETAMTVERLVDALRGGLPVRRSEMVRLAFLEEDERFRFYFNGEEIPVPEPLRPLAIHLADGRRIDGSLLPLLDSPAAQDWIAPLLQDGLLEFDDAPAD